MSEIRPSPNEPGWIHEVMARGHDFGLSSNNGQAIFGKILGRTYARNLEADLYSALATGVSIAAWDGGVAKAWNILKDADNEELLRETQPDHLLQAFVGIDPVDLRVWLQYPSGVKRGNLDKILVDSPANIDTHAYWDGIMSPLEDPHRLTEIIIPPEMPIAFQLFNPTRETIMPFLMFMVIRYEVVWYNPNDPIDMKIIEKFADFIFNNKKERPVKFWMPGIEAFTYGSKPNINTEAVNIRAIAKRLENERVRSGRS